jgi:hypothetical protein
MGISLESRVDLSYLQNPNNFVAIKPEKFATDLDGPKV